MGSEDLAPQYSAHRAERVRTKFREVCTITRGASPRPIIDWVSREGTPWVKISDATSEPGRFLSRTKEFIRNEGRSKSVVVQPGDLIVSNSATPGIPKFMRIEACIHDGWLLLRDFKDVIPEYLFYVLKNDRERLVEKGSGSVFTNLKTEILKNHEFDLPDLQVQEKVAGFLWQIDDKIALNDAISRNLEVLAQTIFESWFIDFDPVKAKMAGEAPVGLDAETAALFPDSMEESELGEVPTGWAVGPISQVLTLQGGYSFKSKDWKNSGVPVVKIGSVKPGFVDATQTSFVSPELAATVPPKFLLPRGSLVIGLTGYVGEVGLVERFPETPLLNQRVARFGLVNSPWRIPFAYCITRGKKFKEDVIASATGSAQANVSTSDILALHRVIPTGDLIERFDALFEPLFEQILLLREQGASLRELRDSLLPRLVSGELEIPEEMLAV